MQFFIVEMSYISVILVSVVSIIPKYFFIVKVISMGQMDFEAKVNITCLDLTEDRKIISTYV